MVLEDIAQIIIGVVEKRKVAKFKSLDTNHYEVFNLRSYEEKMNYDTLYSEQNLDEFIARKGDLILRLAFPLKIFEVDDEIEGKLVNNHYCIIRIQNRFKNTYNIDFIKWFLESNKAKKQYEKVLIGTTVKIVPVLELRKIEVPNLNLKAQIKISKIVDSWTKQKELYNRLIEKKEKYYDSVINKLINGGNE